MANVTGQDIEKRVKGQSLSIYDWLNSPVNKAEIARGLAGAIDIERFTRVVLTALNENPNLQRCTAESIMAAVMTSAQLGLEPNTPLGEAHLIPYMNNKTGQLEAKFQTGYPGIAKLAYRTGEYKSIEVRAVFENDHFRYAYGLDPILEHIPDKKPGGEPTYYYAVYRLKNGGSSFEVWSREKVEAHAKRFSKAYNSGPWKTDFPAMAKKTVLMATLKYAPKTIELAKQITAEEIADHEPPTFGVTANVVMQPTEDVIDGEVVEIDFTDSNPQQPVTEPGGDPVDSHATAPAPDPAAPSQNKAFF